MMILYYEMVCKLFDFLVDVKLKISDLLIFQLMSYEYVGEYFGWCLTNNKQNGQ